MAGPTQATTQITEGAGQDIAGYTNGYSSFTQAFAAGANAPVTGTWNASSASGTNGVVIPINCEGHGIGLVSYTLTNTIASGVVTFEAYDGTAWQFVKGLRVDGTYAEQTYNLSQPSMVWQFNLGGFKQFRVRLSQTIVTTTSGTASFSLSVQAGSITPIVMANLMTALQYDKDTITMYPRGGAYYNITTNSTNVLKFSAGTFLGFTQGDPGTAWQAVVTDNIATGGAVIGTYKFPFTGTQPPIAFATGCTVVTSGTTPGNVTAVVI